MLKRLLFLIAILLFVINGFAQVEHVFDFSIGDTPVGKSTYKRDKDGNISSKTEFQVGTIKVNSTFEGKFLNGKLTEYTLEHESSDEKVTINAKGDKLKAVVGKNTTEVAFSPAEYFMANMHPAVMLNLEKIYPQTMMSPKKEKMFFIENGIEMEVEFRRGIARSIVIDEKRIVALTMTLRFPTGVDIDVYFEPNGEIIAWNVTAQRFKAVRKGFEELLKDPTTLYPELSQPTYSNLIRENNIKIKMRDGVELVGDLVRPDTEEKVPCILVRTPYNRKMSLIDADWWARRGYAYFVQDCRGRHESGGEWEPFLNERKDGFDTIEWISKQDWNNGSVGMIGGSYGGFVQWTAAVEAPPALKCIIPQVSPPDLFFNIPYDYGIFMLYGAVWWANYVKDKETMVGAPPSLGKSIDKFLTLPLSKVDDEVLGVDIPFYNKWLQMNKHSDFEKGNFEKDLNKVNIPALYISGWWDGDGIGTKRIWTKMRSLQKQNQYLIYGPWTHAFNTTSQIGDTDYGSEAILELQSVYLRWFDHWLKNKKVEIEKMPKVRVFVTGLNQWRDLDDWPASQSSTYTLYLGSQGPANGNTSKGTLAETPAENGEPDRYTYNPAGVKVDTSFTDANPASATTIIKFEDTQQDVLIYKTEPLEESLIATGPCELDLFFSTSAVDTDFFFTIVDIDPNGVMRIVGLPGKMKMQYLSGWDSPSLLTPGKVYKATLEHWDFAHEFKKGHRIGVVILSSYFPMWARNLNTGESLYDGARIVSAHQTIYHGKNHPSALRFRKLK